MNNKIYYLVIFFFEQHLNFYITKQETTPHPLPETEGAKGCGARFVQDYFSRIHCAIDTYRSTRSDPIHGVRSFPCCMIRSVNPATASLGGKVTVRSTIWLTHARKPDPLLFPPFILSLLRPLDSRLQIIFENIVQA